MSLPLNPKVQRGFTDSNNTMQYQAIPSDIKKSIFLVIYIKTIQCNITQSLAIQK